MSDARDPLPRGPAPAFDTDARCDECGVFGAHPVGEGHLCTECFVAKGSCCSELGKDDLWRCDDRSDGKG